MIFEICRRNAGDGPTRSAASLIAVGDTVGLGEGGSVYRIVFLAGSKAWIESPGGEHQEIVATERLRLIGGAPVQRPTQLN